MATNDALIRRSATAESRASFRAEPFGHLVLITPLTIAAKGWIRETIPPDAARMDGTLVIEPRYFPELADHIIAAGFTFEHDTSFIGLGMTGAPKTDEEWRQAEALMIWRQHGVDASSFIARRMVELAMSDDVAGVARFQAIGAALNHLMDAARQ